MNAIGQFFFDPTAGDDESAGRVQGPGFYIQAAVYVCSQNRRKKTLRIRCDHTINYRSRLVRARAVLPRLPRSTANTADGGRGDDTLESENRPSRPITMRVILRVFRRSGRPIFDGGGRGGTEIGRHNVRFVFYNEDDECVRSTRFLFSTTNTVMVRVFGRYTNAHIMANIWVKTPTNDGLRP